MGVKLVWRKNFGEKLSEDAKIRKYLKVRLSKASVSKLL